MIGYGMLYAAAVGLPILLAAVACSSLLRRYGRPERGVWLIALGLALTLPVAFLINAFGGTSPGGSETLAEIGLPAVAAGTLPETGVLGFPTVVAIPVESGLGLDEVLLLLWLLTSVVLTLRWAVAAHRLARVGASWHAGTVDGVRVWLTSDLGPAVSGVLRTRILVPSWLVSLPEKQRSLVLLHEEEHVRARDPVLMAVSRIARFAVPWNPVVWLLSSRLLHAVELDCDRRVLGRRPDVETYGDTLLAVSARDYSPLVAAAAFAESEVPLRKRIIAMTTPPRTVSVLGVLTVLTLGVVLLIGSCEVPVPRALEPEGQNNILRVSIEQDGSVYINDELYPMEEVSAVVAALYAASEQSLVTSIRAVSEVPYQVVDQLQQELVAAGAVRVMFQVVDSLTLRSPPDEAADLMDRGLGIVLPPQVPEGVRVNARNVLHLTVQASGIVEVRRGVGTQVRLLWPQDVEGLWRQEAAYNPNLIAAVRTHPNAPYKYMVEVLEALRAADAERISLQVLEAVEVPSLTQVRLISEAFYRFAELSRTRAGGAADTIRVILDAGVPEPEN